MEADLGMIDTKTITITDDDDPPVVAQGDIVPGALIDIVHLAQRENDHTPSHIHAVDHDHVIAIVAVHLANKQMQSQNDKKVILDYNLWTLILFVSSFLLSSSNLYFQMSLVHQCAMTDHRLFELE